MTISAATISLLVDAGLSGEMLKRVATSIENDVTLARHSERHMVTDDVTPSALRMRRLRERKLNQNNVLDAEKAASVAEQERHIEASQGVTSYNIPSLSLEVGEGKKDSIVRSVTRKRHSYAALFETFWTGYPTDSGMSKAEAAKAFDRLSPEDQQAAIDALPAFRKWITEQGDSYRTVHAVRYITQRRFEGFQTVAEKVSQRAGEYIKGDTDEMDAWDAHLLKTTGRRSPRDSKRGWWHPSQWPPGYVPTEYPEERSAA